MQRRQKMRLSAVDNKEKHSSFQRNERKLISPAHLNLWFHAPVDLETKRRPARNDGNEMAINDNLSFSPSILV
jgi:hypothetical protein